MMEWKTQYIFHKKTMMFFLRVLVQTICVSIILFGLFIDKYGYIDSSGNQFLPAVWVINEGQGEVTSEITTVAPLFGDIAGEYYYSELFNQWRGRDGKL